MAVINKGKTFANGEQVTAGKLNLMFDGASFGSGAVDGTSIVTSGGALTLGDGGITIAKCSDSEFLQKIYPIGSLYMNANDGTNPSTLMGFGTWEQFSAGRMVLGFGEGTDTRGQTTNFNSAGDTSGEYNHLLTHQESGLPAHNHIEQHFHTNGSGDGSGPGASCCGGAIENSGVRTLNNSTQNASQVHNNMPPYIVVYIWRRTA